MCDPVIQWFLSYNVKSTSDKRKANMGVTKIQKCCKNILNMKEKKKQIILVSNVYYKIWRTFTMWQ